MGKTIKRIKIVSFIIIIIQLVLIGSFAVLYFNKLFQVDEIPNMYIVLGASGLVFFDSLFVWIVALVISSLRQKTDLRAAEVIGGDVQEAYNFAMIGLMVTDDSDTIIWTNATVKTVINSRNYEVKYLADAGLWIFKDITDFESIFAYSKQQAPVVGILAIDNYVDVIRGEDDFNDVVTKVKNVIFAYAKEYGILLRRVKDDNYSMLCNYDSFSRMKADKFSIIDKVREVSSGEDIPLTLSIGLAHDFPDVIKLNELANSALNIAVSRGGDQVVVSVFGGEMEFFGGKTEAQEIRNRVKSRVLAASLISL